MRCTMLIAAAIVLAAAGTAHSQQAEVRKPYIKQAFADTACRISPCVLDFPAGRKLEIESIACSMKSVLHISYSYMLGMTSGGVAAFRVPLPYFKFDNNSAIGDASATRNDRLPYAFMHYNGLIPFHAFTPRLVVEFNSSGQSGGSPLLCTIMGHVMVPQ